MKLRTVFAAGALVLGSLSLAGCSKVEGTYKIDKAEMKKAFEAEIAKMPADQQGFAKLALGMIDSMEMSIELKSGGKAEMKVSMMGKEETKTGDWKADGKKVTITGDGKSINCDAEGGKLTCEGDKPGQPKIVLTKS